MGLLTLYGVISIGAEKWCWLGISILAAVTVAHRVEDNAFGHGAFVGLLLGVTSKLIQAVWAGTYAAHNPVLQEKLSGPIDGAQFQYRMLMLVPFVGVINAILVGLMSHFTWRAKPRFQKGRSE